MWAVLLSHLLMLIVTVGGALIAVHFTPHEAATSDADE